MRYKACLLLSVILFLLVGCQQVEVKETQTKNVKNALPNPQTKVDIYVPLREQFKNSGHTESINTLAKAMQGPDSHVTSNCFRCHSYITDPKAYEQIQLEQLPQKLPAISCGNCHIVTGDGDYVLKKENFNELCITCHTGDMKGESFTAGKEVHHPHLEMITGKGAIGVPAMPSSFYTEGVSCADCHMPNQSHEFLALTPMEAKKNNRQDSCIFCHYSDPDPDSFSKHIEEIKEKNDKAINELSKFVKDNKEKVNASNDLKIKEIYNRLVTNVSMLAADGSYGIHNAKYARAILDKSEADRKALVEGLQK